MADSNSRFSNGSKRAGLAFALTLAGLTAANAQESAQPSPTTTPPASEATSEAPSPTPTAPAATPAATPTSRAAATPAPTVAPSTPATPDAAHDVAAPGDPAAAPAPPSPLTLVHAEKLPRDLSPWSMFMQADVIVKAVMIGLILASVVTWTVWLAKSVELTAAKRQVRKALQKLSGAASITEASNMLGSQHGAVAAMVRAAMAETRASWDVADKYAIKERVSARLDRLEFAAGRDINRGTGVLATIGSTAPFVGLFGTVWGIMNSFIGISEAQTTNLAIVAPGIAEALLATAFGLVAAIPAVIIYNHFARAIGGYKALVGDASVAVLCLLSRDFDRGVRPELRAAE
jgi:biopolymer transport protein ExbB